MKTFRFYILSKFQLYNTMSSTLVTRLLIRSADLILLITKTLNPFINLSRLPPPFSPYKSIFYFSVPIFFLFHI